MLDSGTGGSPVIIVPNRPKFMSDRRTLCLSRPERLNLSSTMFRQPALIRFRERGREMAQAISNGTRFTRVQLMRALSPSYRRVRARLAMIEAHHTRLS